MKSLFILFFISLACLSAAQESLVDSISVSFPNNKAQIINSELFKSKLRQLKGESFRFVIKGYTDSTGTVLHNQHLASKRMGVVLTAIHGFNLSIAALDTVNANETNGTRLKNDAKNRRVDVLIYSNNPQVVSESEIKPVLNTVINLNVNFVGGKAEFLPSAYSNLNRLLHIMLKDTSLHVKLDGHVCCADDYALSLERAQAVQNYLVNYGVNAKRIKSEGFSNSRRIFFQETTEEKRSANRRVEAILSRP